MTTPNHIVAGTFFTGFWASLWNLNIFSSWEYIVATIFCSLLPDIDHPKTPVGLMFYPIAKWIDKKFGHRTITHSLFFLFGGTALLSLIPTIVNSLHLTPHTLHLSPYPLIFFFAVLSHLILDMVTIQGVPLFYPVRRNPCVMPGNQDYRVVSGKFKTEAVAFSIFVFLNLLCWDLYAKGFWTNYNESFGSLQHLHFERANSSNFTLANYNFMLNGRHYKGKGIVINSTEKECELLINDTVYKLDNIRPGLVVNNVTAIKTNFPFSITNKAFTNSEIIPISEFIAGQIVSGTINSNESFISNFSSEQKAGTSATFHNDYNVSIFPNPTITVSDKSNILKQIAVKQQTLIQDKINFQKSNSEYYRLQSVRSQLQQKVNSADDLSVKNSLENELIKINNKLLLMPAPAFTQNTVTLEEIHQLNILLNKPDSVLKQSFTANLSIINIPDTLRKLQ